MNSPFGRPWRELSPPHSISTFSVLGGASPPFAAKPR